MLRKEQKTAVINANRTHENDTGSPEVQVAILTAYKICTNILLIVKKRSNIILFFKQRKKTS